MRTTETVTCVALIALGALALFWIIPRQTIGVDEGELPGALLPSGAALVIIIASAFQLITSRIAEVPAAPITKRNGAGAWLGSAAIFAIALAAAWWMITSLGYLFGSAIMIAIAGLALRPTGAARWWLLIVAVVAPVAVYYTTWHLLRLSLP